MINKQYHAESSSAFESGGSKPTRETRDTDLDSDSHQDITLPLDWFIRFLTRIHESYKFVKYRL